MSQPSDDGSVDVSIILPVFNEAGHLDNEVERIRKTMDDSAYSYEIVVVDDGSTDGSSQRLREIEGIRLLQFTTNRGSGSARKYGTQAARGRIVVWTDVDMTYPNDTIPDLLDELAGFDQVVGARATEEGTLKLLRLPAKWMIRRLASYLSGVRIPDLNSGFRAFRQDRRRGTTPAQSWVEGPTRRVAALRNGGTTGPTVRRRGTERQAQIGAINLPTWPSSPPLSGANERG